MRKFIGEHRKVYLVFSKNVSMGNAVLLANKSFKTSFRNLYVTEATVIDDKLYFPQTKGNYPKGDKESVWAVFTKGGRTND